MQDCHSQSCNGGYNSLELPAHSGPGHHLVLTLSHDEFRCLQNFGHVQRISV